MARESVPESERQQHRLQRSESRTSQTYADFIKDLSQQAQADWEQAEEIAASVLCVLEQRLTGGQGRHLEAQLPAKVRELLARCTRHEGNPPEKFHASDMIRRVADDLMCQPEQAEGYIRACCDVLARHVSEGELDKVVMELPEDIRAFFRPLV